MSFVIAAPTPGAAYAAAEVGPNVMHDQWFWMNDPEICSSAWEWDT